MRVSKLLAVLVVLSLLLSPLASFPVQASDPNDPDGDDDNDSDGYDSNQDGEISDEEKYKNLEENSLPMVEIDEIKLFYHDQEL